jgi:hypothetical protein
MACTIDLATHTTVANLKVGTEDLNGKTPTFTCISEAQIRSATKISYVSRSQCPTMEEKLLLDLPAKHILTDK